MSTTKKKTLAGVGAAALLIAGLVATTLPAEANLAGSSFEIDDGNLVVNAAGKIDWASVTEIRKGDTPTGQTDNSFGDGSKEDSNPPAVVAGRIPNNKSDLQNFGAYLESVGGQRYLNLFWTRVQDPTGTTNMDFELNQSSTVSSNGVTPVRTAGDALIMYDLSSGGTKPTLWLSRWVGTGAASLCEANNATPCWGKRTNLTAGGLADGSINLTAITAGNADGLGALSARTFGEAAVNFDALTGGGSNCISFGSAYLKSRSSDTFNSALKDFIAPTSASLSNCGMVTIRKQTNPDEANNSTSFGFTSTVVTNPASAQNFSLADDGVKSFANVVQGTYTVNESALPAGWTLHGIDCSASSGVSTIINGAQLSFTIDSASDVVDCTYINRAQAALHVTKVAEGGGSRVFNFTSGSLSSPSFTLSNGSSMHFLSLTPGLYDVAESDADGWNLASATCDNGDDPSAVTLDAGDDVTCTFTNVPETGAILIHKDRKHAASGAGNHPQSGVEFMVAGTTKVTTNANGNACIDGLQFATYAISELVPAGYHAVGETTKNVTVDNEATCGDDPFVGETVDFLNMPLTTLTMSVDSQIDGGTASTITCDFGGGVTGANGDGSVTSGDLEPGTYTCEVVVDP